jgi:integrase/recombinase XerD
MRAVKKAAELAGVEGKVTPHCLRHSFCTHLLDGGQNIRRVQEAMGHTDVRTTAGYARRECLDMVSPLDRLTSGFLQLRTLPACHGLTAQ